MTDRKDTRKAVKKLIAFDLDGTLTQHKTPLSAENRLVLDQLSKRYRLVMVCAGSAMRVFRQMCAYPIDIIGNYGMQLGEYDAAEKTLVIRMDEHVPVDKESVRTRIDTLRTRFGYTRYAGDSVEFHDSGCVTFPLLGTAAVQADKLAFDPDRSKRRPIYEDVKAAFPEYTVFVGGSSSFDFAPKPFDKYYALDRYCNARGISHAETMFIGDDYGVGGNDECIFLSDIPSRPIDDYRKLLPTIQDLL